jgi:hypothetical protein
MRGCPPQGFCPQEGPAPHPLRLLARLIKRDGDSRKGLNERSEIAWLVGDALCTRPKKVFGILRKFARGSLETKKFLKIPEF